MRSVSAQAASYNAAHGNTWAAKLAAEPPDPPKPPPVRVNDHALHVGTLRVREGEIARSIETESMIFRLTASWSIDAGSGAASAELRREGATMLSLEGLIAKNLATGGITVDSEGTVGVNAATDTANERFILTQSVESGYKTIVGDTGEPYAGQYASVTDTLRTRRGEIGGTFTASVDVGYIGVRPPSEGWRSLAEDAAGAVVLGGLFLSGLSCAGGSPSGCLTPVPAR